MEKNERKGEGDKDKHNKTNKTQEQQKETKRETNGDQARERNIQKGDKEVQQYRVREIDKKMQGEGTIQRETKRDKAEKRDKKRQI